MKKIVRPRTFSLYILLCAICIFNFSCGKEGPGGKGGIKGMVRHHALPIPGAVVYIKYGVKESAGTNTTYYDASVNADANANYEFTDLKKGDYYLLGIGFDSVIVQVVTGGIPVSIRKNETAQADVPVTEE